MKSCLCCFPATSSPAATPGGLVTPREQRGERPEDIHDQALRDVFDRFDTNNDGVIDKDELVGLLTDHLNLKTAPTEVQIGRIMRRVDLDGDGKIQFKEFKKMMDNRDTANKHLETFQKLDINNDGYIVKEELARRMREIHVDVTEEEIDTIFNSLDESNHTCFIFLYCYLPLFANRS